jgi:hypothetical protein
MNILVLFGQRRERYEGEYAPEVMLAWDEATVEENPDGFDKAVDDARREAGDDMASTRIVRVTVDGDRIRRLLVGTPTVAGEVADAEA